MIVVGVGCGPGLLTQCGSECIARAKQVYGSERAIELAKEHISPGSETHVIEDYANLADLPEDSVLLSTGDPMLAGLGQFGTEVVPGISSMQLAFSRLKLPLMKAAAVDAHAQDGAHAVKEAVEELGRGKIPFILAKPGFDLQALADALLPIFSNCKIVTCEDLGYRWETISVGTPSRPPLPCSRLFSVVVVRMP